MNKLRILIVEDEPTIATEISFILKEEGFEVAGIAHNSTKALDYLATKTVDFAMLDISIKGDKSGIDIAHIINEKYKIPFVFLSSYSDKMTRDKVRETKPYGYLVKPYKDKDLAPAIETAMARWEESKGNVFPSLELINSKSNSSLTKQEYFVLQKIWEGKSNSQIAEEGFISKNTVKTHISHLFTKLDVSSRSAAIAHIRALTNN